jgi:hypothetical protein
MISLFCHASVAAIAGIAISASATIAGPIEANPRELGRVHWLRDFDEAKAFAQATGKPIFLLFQEIPGCAGCKAFGDQPLSHPLVVEAIEDLFVPVAIHNNKPGKDAEILKRFNETAWNYPVARLLDAKGVDLIPRQEGLFAVGEIATRMIAALKAAQREAPAYLQLVADESNTAPGSHEVVTFAMSCFWEGEAKLGGIDGVISTRAGFVDASEAVEVVYNPQRVKYEDLVTSAQQMQCASVVYAHTEEQLKQARAIAGPRARKLERPAKDAPASDQKHTLAHNTLNYLPLTPMQATKVNAALHTNQDYRPWLSPRQIELLGKITTALARDRSALTGLQRPDAIEQLNAFQDQLRGRVEATGSTSAGSTNSVRP